MAATLGLRSIVMLVGAGYTGSFFYNNFDPDRVRTLAANILLAARDSAPSSSSDRTAAGAGGGNASSADTSSVAALAAQVDRLTTEITRRADMSAGGSGPVVLLPSAATGYRGVLATLSDAFNLLGWAVFGVSVSGAVYYVAVRKRVALRDLAWVSQGTFNGTVAALQSGLQRVNAVVASVSAELATRLGRVETRVDDVHDSLKAELAEQVGRVTHGVADLRADVSALSDSVDDTRRQIDAVDGKIDFSNHGIALLVKAVAKLHPNLLRDDQSLEMLSRTPGISSEIRLAIEAVTPSANSNAREAAKDSAAAAERGAKSSPTRRDSARASNGGLSFLLGPEPASETVDATAKATGKGAKTKSFEWTS